MNAGPLGLRRRDLFETAAVAIVAGVFFVVATRSLPHLIGYDAYYNVGIARLWLEEGFTRQLPSIQNSILTERFHDPQLLLHLIIAGLMIVGANPIMAGQLAAAGSAALLAAGISVLCRTVGIRHPWLVALLALTAAPFTVTRLCFVKSTPLFSLCVIALAIGLLRRHRPALLLICWGAAYVYQGYLLLPVLVLVFAVVEAVAERRPRLVWDLSAPAIAGAALGTVLQPTFPNNLQFMWVELWMQLADRPENVALSGEWRGMLSSDYLVLAGGPLVVLLGSALLAWACGVALHRRALLALSAMALVGVASLRASRTLDYFLPLAVVCTAYLFSQAVATRGPLAAERLRRVGLGILLFVGVPVIIEGTELGLQNGTGIANGIDAPSYRAVAEELHRRDARGEIVVAPWDDFPMLFFYERGARYTEGINQLYSYARDPQLADAQRLLFEGRVQDPVFVMRQLHARWLVVTQAGRQGGRRALASALAARSDFELVMSRGPLQLFRFDG